MKLHFGDYSVNVRGIALKLLYDRGIHVWDVNFDPNSVVVLGMCHDVEHGTVTVPDDRAMYVWTRQQVVEFANRAHATPGKRTSKSKAWKDIPQG